MDGAVNRMQQGGCEGVIRDDKGDFIADVFFQKKIIVIACCLR